MGDLREAGSIGLHDEELARPRSGARERDLRPVGRPRRLRVRGGVVGQVGEGPIVEIEHEDVVPLRPSAQRELRSVGGPREIDAFGDGHRARAIRVGHDDVAPELWLVAPVVHIAVVIGEPLHGSLGGGRPGSDRDGKTTQHAGELRHGPVTPEG